MQIHENRNHNIKKIILFIFISILTFCVFIPSLNNNFVYDDIIYIVYNEFIKKFNFNTINWAFTEYFTNYWAPLTWLSYAVDYAIWGLDPFGYHLTNNILHALNTGILFLLFACLLKLYSMSSAENTLKRPGFTENELLLCAALAAIIHAIHPLRVQSVSWAAERKDVLSFFFGMLSLVMYIKFISLKRHNDGALPENPRYYRVTVYYSASIVLYMFSLCSKATLVTMPFILLILDWFPAKRLNSPSAILKASAEKIPYILCALYASIQIYTSHKTYGSLMNVSDSDILSRLFIALKAVYSYLYLTILPFNISPYYNHPGTVNVFTGEYLFPILLTIAIIVACFYKFNQFIFVIGIIYIITLLPVLGIIQPGFEAMAARFTYIPSVGLSLLYAVCLFKLHAFFKDSTAGKTCLIAGTIAVMSLNVYLTIRDQSHWQDNVSLWSRVIQVTPGGRAYELRARAYDARGEYEAALQDYNSAYSIALQKRRSVLPALHGMRGGVLVKMGRLNEALQEYTQGLNIPIEHDIRTLNMLYLERGKLYKMLGQNERAESDFLSASQTR